MGRVVIREYTDLQRSRSGDPTGLLRGSLATDELGTSIKTVDTAPGTSVDCAALTSRTHFVALEADSDMRYVVRPKKFRYVPLAATADHSPLPAGSEKMEAVYPGAILSFLQTSPIGGVVYPFQQAYIPVLAL